jgi:hypothetical protein
MVGRRSSNNFLKHLLLALLEGRSADEFAEQEARRMSCGFCRDGWPLKNGQHTLLGAVVPCEADSKKETRW